MNEILGEEEKKNGWWHNGIVVRPDPGLGWFRAVTIDSVVQVHENRT